MIRTVPLLLAALLVPAAGCGQERLVGGPCEGCEAIFEWGERVLTPSDTLPDFGRSGPRMLLTGTIYEPDGKTPASGVVLYIYHTDQEGVYPARGDEEGWGRRHGYLRGWIRTGESGRYAFYTLKPGTYPSRAEPAHVHGTILEPDGKYYWIDSWHFVGDPLLEDTEEDAPRGDSGVVRLRSEGGLLVAERDIVLGRNVPEYRRP